MTQSRPTNFARANLAVLSLLLASGLCLLLIAFRNSRPHHTDFWFLAKNLFLAWVPMVCASAAHFLQSRGAQWRWLVGIFAVIWFLFYPNAPYLITDIIHLQITGLDTRWLDVLLVMSFIWVGLLLGNLSLQFMHEMVRAHRGPAVGWVFAIAMLAFGAIGVFVGRFWRWNSKDFLFAPKTLAADALWRLRFMSFPDFQLFFTAFFSFSLITYLTLYAFAHVHGERAAPASPEAAP